MSLTFDVNAVKKRMQNIVLWRTANCLQLRNWCVTYLKARQKTELRITYEKEIIISE